MRIRTFFHVVLAGMALFLCGKIVAVWRRPLPAILPNAEQTPSDASGLGRLQPMQPPEAVTQMVEAIAAKDLFTPDRGEVTSPIVEEPKTVVEPPSHLKLVGVLMSRARAEAFLADSSQGNKVFRVKQGDSIGQYQLLQIDPKEVKVALGSSGEVASLQLRILDSATSQQAPHIIPAVQQNVGDGRPGSAVGRILAQPNVVGQSGVSPQTQEEAQALRSNIQRMQQRLRRLRRRAAREEAQAREARGDNDEEEDDSSDEE
ncbi:MAG: hypothetical protein AB7G75_22930 [Candidatus Binatia bacterium]